MITWEQRRGQIKHLLYELCLTGRIDRATFYEQIADLNKVAPVVRCKDCKYRNGDYCNNYQGFAYFDHFFTRPDDFCSRGEKLDEVEDANR